MSDYTIPKGYERIDHHELMDLFNESKGIVITIHERDMLYQKRTGEYPYKVIAAQNQKTLYEGTFDSLSNAENKVIELANKY